MTLAQLHFLRRELHGRLEGRQTLLAVAQMSAASALLGLVSYGVWYALDRGLGTGLLAQIASVGGGLAAGALVYGVTVHLLRIPEARQIERLLAGRLLQRAKR
jgi:putative peptidoglycan lipid II flippase